MDGRPRENFHPAVAIDPEKEKGDAALAFALNYLQRLRRQGNCELLPLS